MLIETSQSIVPGFLQLGDTPQENQGVGEFNKMTCFENQYGALLREVLHRSQPVVMCFYLKGENTEVCSYTMPVETAEAINRRSSTKISEYLVMRGVVSDPNKFRLLSLWAPKVQNGMKGIDRETAVSLAGGQIDKIWQYGVSFSEDWKELILEIN